LDATAAFLRENGFQVIVVASPEVVSEALREYNGRIAAVILLVTNGDPRYLRFLEQVRRSTHRIKTIVQIMGCNQDELGTELLSNVDLVVNSDEPRSELPAKIKSVLENPS
jgi:DNA-binding response OmpR family regulator